MEEKGAPELDQLRGGDGGGDIVWPWRLMITASNASSNADPIPFPLSADIFPPSASKLPVLIRELVGHPCRVVTPTTVITEDFNPNRVNVLVNEHDVIIDIRYG